MIVGYGRQDFMQKLSKWHLGYIRMQPRPWLRSLRELGARERDGRAKAEEKALAETMAISLPHRPSLPPGHLLPHNHHHATTTLIVLCTTANLGVKGMQRSLQGERQPV